MKKIHPYARIIAIDPFHRWFGFAVLEGERRLIDWGTARICGTNDNEFLARVESLINRYKPIVVVLQEPSERKRSDHAVRRIESVSEYSQRNNLGPVLVSKTEVKKAFEQAGSTKREIAVGIAALYPDLEPYLPPNRKPWMSEDGRSQVFDSVAMALTAAWETGQPPR